MLDKVVIPPPPPIPETDLPKTSHQTLLLTPQISEPEKNTMLDHNIRDFLPKISEIFPNKG